MDSKKFNKREIEPIGVQTLIIVHLTNCNINLMKKKKDFKDSWSIKDKDECHL